MAKTKIADVIVPEIFAQYVIERTAELSAFVQSGIITGNAELNQLVSGGGVTINMPFWRDLDGDVEILSDTRPLTPDKISTGRDIAVVNYRGKAWSSNQLAGALAGSDPMAAIGDLAAYWWVRQEQKQLLAILDGVFKSPSMADLKSDQSGKPIDTNTVLDAKQLLGDAYGQLTAMAIHSAVFTQLQKQNVIDYIPDARSEIQIPTYLGYRVIIDDGMPTDGTNFVSYLFASGVIGRGDGTPVGSFEAVEMDRDVLAGDDYLVNNRAYVLHPMGVAWKGTPSNPENSSPDNDDFATGANWERVVEAKKMGIVQLTHSLS